MSRWISLHSFRHAKVFSLLDQGWKIEKVAAYMGHKSVQTTFQYVHLGPEEMRSEAERVAGNGVKRQVPNHSTMQDNGAAIQLKSLYDQGILSKDEYLLKMETLLGVL